MSPAPRKNSLEERSSLVSSEALGVAAPLLSGFGEFLDSLPDIYAGRDFRTLARHWATCAQNKK
ncbi:MAG: hypothetical protein MK213_08375, partial [Planctomycetes bacterium]|nr:hypothetical protein [Planctomycetota bacterium]